MSDFGVALDREGTDMEFNTTFTGKVTVAEYQAMFGMGASIVRDMSHYTVSDVDGIALQVFPNDVLACETWNSMHHIIINAFLTDVGFKKMEDPDIEDRARCYDDISPDAALFLMEMYNRASNVNRVNHRAELLRARAAGLSLSDFLRPA